MTDEPCFASWATCRHAYRTLKGGKGWTSGLPVMKCRLTGRHPDYCVSPSNIETGRPQQ